MAIRLNTYRVNIKDAVFSIPFLLLYLRLVFWGDFPLFLLLKSIKSNIKLNSLAFKKLEMISILSASMKSFFFNY